MKQLLSEDMSYRSDYKQYLKSDHWFDLRTRKIAQEPWCQICGNYRNRQVHHLRYKQLFDCDLNDLMTLCSRCHKDLHIGQENYGWTINNEAEARALVEVFRSSSDYATLSEQPPTGIVATVKKKDPYARFGSDAKRIMSTYRKMRPLKPVDVQELINRLKILIAGGIDP